MSMATGAKLQLEPGSWVETVYELLIGFTVGICHPARVIGVWWNTRMVPVLESLGLQSRQETTTVTNDGEKTLKVVAVGYGRTGTYSLMLALEELGYPTLHTQHLYEHEELMKMWDDRVFGPSIDNKSAAMGKPDLQMIADSGFQATTDLPVALYFEQIMEEFPDCKFILTTRHDSDVWFKSWDTLTRSINVPTGFGNGMVTCAYYYSRYLRWLYAVVNNEDSFLTAPHPLPDQIKENAIASYEEHNRRVREVIPSDRLLEYSVTEGWEPLCKFLEQKCPDTPFPKTNSARSVQVQAYTSLIVPVTIAAIAILFAASKGFHHATGMTVTQWVNMKSRELTRVLQRTMIGDDMVAFRGKPMVNKHV